MARPCYRLALFATFLALFVVLLGAYTRLSHSGLGCPDWPGCYGFIHVPQSEAQLARAEALFPHAPVQAGKGWVEMIHRYFASLLGLLILLLALRSLVRRDAAQPRRLPLALLLLVIAQGAFGAWTVTLQLWPQVVTAHLLGGFSTLALLALLSLRLSGRYQARCWSPRRLRLLAGVVLGLVFGQAALGGWVSANYAAMACIDLPTCHGQWWPSMDFANGFHLTQHIGPNYLGGQLDSEARTAIHVTHRLGAVLLSVALLSLAWQLWRMGLQRLAGLLGVLLALQLALGVGNVLLHLPLPLAVAHNAGAAALLLTLVGVNFRLRHLPLLQVRRPSARPFWSPVLGVR